MKLSKIFIVILFSTSQLLAQDIGTTEVRVVEGFIPTIPEASRLNEKAAFADTIKKVRIQEYAVVETDLKSNYKTRPLKAAKVKADKIAQLYATKVGSVAVVKHLPVHVTYVVLHSILQSCMAT